MLPDSHPLAAAQAMLMTLYGDVPEDWLVEFWALMPTIEDPQTHKKVKKQPPPGMKDREMQVVPVVAIEKSFEGALGQWILDTNRKGYESFYGVAPRYYLDTYGNGHYKSGEKKNVSHVPCLWLDIDHEEWEKVVKIHNLKYTFLVSSGHGGHVYIKTPKLVPSSEAENWMTYFIKKKIIGSDKTFDCRRCLRVPGTRNWKEPDPKKIITCELVDSDVEYLFPGFKPEELSAIDAMVREKQKLTAAVSASSSSGSEVESQAVVSQSVIADRVRSLKSLDLQNVIWFGYKHAGEYGKEAFTPEGDIDRSTIDFRVMKELVRHQFTTAECHAVFFNPEFGISAKTVNDEAAKGNAEHYFNTTYEKARLGVEIDSTRGQEIYPDVLPYETDEDLAKASTVMFAIDGLLAVGGMMLISGPAKIGKSMMIEDLILLLAGAEGKFLEHFSVLQPGSVFYLQSEVNKPNLRHRLDRIASSRGTAWNKTPHAKFYFHKRLNLGEPNNVKSLTNAVKESGAKYLVIDPLARFHFLNENKQSDMAKILATIERVAQEAGCIASIVVHHHGKPQEGQEREGLQSLRGASVIGDWANAYAIVKGRRNPRTDEKYAEVSFELRDAEEPNNGIPLKMKRDKLSLRFFPYSEDGVEESEVREIFMENRDLGDKDLLELLNKRLKLSKGKLAQYIASIRLKENILRESPRPTNGNGNGGHKEQKDPPAGETAVETAEPEFYDDDEDDDGQEPS